VSDFLLVDELSRREQSTPEFSVLVPLEDPRGDVVEHLRTWTLGQTFARERYQVVVASDAADPQLEAKVAAELAAHDAVVQAPGGNLIDLWNASSASPTSTPRHSSMVITATR
jgi:hypothetical protein